MRDERSVRPCDVLRKPKAGMIYEYDFGDSWTHDVVLECIAPAEKGVRYPRSAAGKGACPPEDCGGAVRDPSHPDHEEMVEWSGEGFEAEVFGFEEVDPCIRPSR